MTEIWKPIPSLPGYEASSCGRIRRAVVLSNNHPPRVMKCTTFNSGYICFQTRLGDKRYTAAVHRLVCEAFHGPAPFPRAEVRHLDGSRDNNSPENLQWGSAKENAADRTGHGRTARGEDHRRAGMDKKIVTAMFRLSAKGMTAKDISEVFDVHKSTVSRVLAGTSWAHIHGERPSAA